MKICDMCGFEIINKKCSCGTWKNAEEMQDDPMRKAIEQFDEMKRFTLTGDAPHLGCAFIFFRGDYYDAQIVEKFIYQMKKRPYYED